MKILVTGFDPFGQDIINPAYEVVKRIRDNIDGAEIIKIQIPTVFKKCTDKVIEKINQTCPDVVLMIGQAGGRYDISIERVAINIDDARIPDNEKQKPLDNLIDLEGLNAYFATIPIKSIVQGIRNINIPASVSNSAGTFVCNNVMYGVLNYIYKNKLDIKAGFIHIPFLFEQVIDRPITPAMDLNTMIKGIEEAISIIVNREERT